MKTALERAVEHFGGQKRLAERIGTSQSQVWYWLREAKKGVPGEYALAIERESEGAISRRDLRPDLYPPEAAA